MANYFGHEGGKELGRMLQLWDCDGPGSKSHGSRCEPLMAVDHMDLHRLHGDAGGQPDVLLNLIEEPIRLLVFGR